MEIVAGQSSATPAVAPPNNPNFLPPPLYLHDPALYARIQAHLWAPQRGLQNPERTVLGAVFRNMPAPTPPPQVEGESSIAADPLPASWLIDQILDFTAPQLRLLARLFTVALLDARSWGGRRPTDNSTPASPAGTPKDPITLFTPLFMTLGLSHLPSSPGLDPPTANPPAAPSRRKLRQKENCMLRHDNCCPISLRSATTLTHAHIIPHSVSSDPQSSAPFWMLLTLILGPTVRDRFWDILGGDMVYTTMNSIALTQDLHTYFDTGLLHLAPSPSLLSEPFNYKTCTSYDVVFHWYHDNDELNTWTTQLPVHPDEQLVSTVNLSYKKTAVRQLRDRDVFRLYTNTPETQPLVHPLLLELHGVVWRMIVETGLGESAVQRKRSRAEAGIDGNDDNPRPPSRVAGESCGKGRGGRGDNWAKRGRGDLGKTGESSGGNRGGRARDAADRAPQMEVPHSLPHDPESPSTVTRETKEEMPEARKTTSSAERIRRQLLALESCSEDEDIYQSGEYDTYDSEQDTRPVAASPLTNNQQRAERIRRQLYALESCSDNDEDEDHLVAYYSSSDEGENDNSQSCLDLEVKNDRDVQHPWVEGKQLERVRTQLFALESFCEDARDLCSSIDGNSSDSEESNSFNSDIEEHLEYKEANLHAIQPWSEDGVKSCQCVPRACE